MDRQGRGPPPRQSSLPSSLHRLLVPDPSHPRRSATQEESGGASPEGGEDPWRPAPATPAHPIPSAPTGQQLPPTILAHAVFEEPAASDEAGGSQRQSISPAPGTVSHNSGAATRTLTLPPPPRGVVRSDPAFYASMPTYQASYSVQPPGPPLPPISWSSTGMSGGPSLIAPLTGGDRREVRPVSSLPPQPGPSRLSPLSPIAGPSQQAEDPPPRRRKPKAKKPQQTIPPPEAGPSFGSVPASQRPRGSDDALPGEPCAFFFCER